MTIASGPRSEPLAPRGRLVDPRDDRCAMRLAAPNAYPAGPWPAPHAGDPCPGVSLPRRGDPLCGHAPLSSGAGQRGVFVRAYVAGYDDADLADHARGDPELDPRTFKSDWEDPDQGRHVKGFVGAVSGSPGATRFRIRTDVSRDQISGLLYGAFVTDDVFRRRNVEPEWRRRIAEIVAEFATEFVRNGLRVADVSGQTTCWGDHAPFEANGVPQDPTNFLQTLAWIKTAAVVSGSPALQAAYDAQVARHLGGRGPETIFRALDLVLEPLLRDHNELVTSFGLPGYRYFQLLTAIHTLERTEARPEVRAYYLYALDHVLRPLFDPLRSPLFDGMLLAAHGVRDESSLGLQGPVESLRGRIAGVLAQYRATPPPFGKPAAPTLACADDTSPWRTDYSRCRVLTSPLHSWIEGIAQGAGAQVGFKVGDGIWPLGPGLVPGDNLVEGPDTFYLSGYDPGGTRGGVLQPSGYDYMLAYWFARFHGLI
jgi:hypothetical protein